MTTTEERVMKGLERWEASQIAAGYTKCECGNWGRGECRACNEINPVVTLAALVGLAMTVK